ncbi:ATPase [Raoultella ornithinolytica]|nr:ATPase [Raoultella ornithinolytica]
MSAGYWMRFRLCVRQARRRSSVLLIWWNVLYEKQCQLIVVAACGLSELVADVEQEDIQRTYSRLLQLGKT